MYLKVINKEWRQLYIQFYRTRWISNFGSIKLAVNFDSQNQQVIVNIKDTGIGMSASQVKELQRDIRQVNNYHYSKQTIEKLGLR